MSMTLLVQTYHVSCWVAEPRRDLGRVRADRLHDFASVGGDGIKGRGHAVNHHVNEKAWAWGRRAVEYPTPAHFTGRVVKRDGTITSISDVPAEHPCVELGGKRNVCSGYLDVADLAVRKRGRHRCPSGPSYSSTLLNPVFLQSPGRVCCPCLCLTKSSP